MSDAKIGCRDFDEPALLEIINPKLFILSGIGEENMLLSNLRMRQLLLAAAMVNPKLELQAQQTFIENIMAFST
jgi:hypothetical protein